MGGINKGERINRSLIQVSDPTISERTSPGERLNTPFSQHRELMPVSWVHSLCFRNLYVQQQDANTFHPAFISLQYYQKWTPIIVNKRQPGFHVWLSPWKSPQYYIHQFRDCSIGRSTPLNLEANASINCKQPGKETAFVVIFSFMKERRDLFIHVMTKKLDFFVLK